MPAGWKLDSLGYVGLRAGNWKAMSIGDGRIWFDRTAWNFKDVEPRLKWLLGWYWVGFGQAFKVRGLRTTQVDHGRPIDLNVE